MDHWIEFLYVSAHIIDVFFSTINSSFDCAYETEWYVVYMISFPVWEYYRGLWWWYYSILQERAQGSKEIYVPHDHW